VNVLFVCIQNAGRSQMAEALFRLAAGDRHQARSAGSAPAEHVHPEVVEAMRELGIDLGERAPQALEPADAEWADLVVTMGCGDACPVIPGKRYVDWQLDDPHGQPLAKVREIRDEIGRRVEDVVRELDAAQVPPGAGERADDGREQAGRSGRFRQQPDLEEA
jgi:arsenate reductase